MPKRKSRQPDVPKDTPDEHLTTYGRVSPIIAMGGEYPSQHAAYEKATYKLPPEARRRVLELWVDGLTVGKIADAVQKEFGARPTNNFIKRHVAKNQDFLEKVAKERLGALLAHGLANKGKRIEALITQYNELCEAIKGERTQSRNRHQPWIISNQLIGMMMERRKTLETIAREMDQLKTEKADSAAMPAETAKAIEDLTKHAQGLDSELRRILGGAIVAHEAQVAAGKPPRDDLGEHEEE